MVLYAERLDAIADRVQLHSGRYPLEFDLSHGPSKGGTIVRLSAL